MPLPNTLTGMIGFIIFVGGITSLLYIDLNPNDPIVQLNKANEDAQNQFQSVFAGLNQSTNGSVPDNSNSLFSLTTIINFFLYLFFMPLRILTYIGIITIVLSPAGGLPNQFIILDFIIVTTIIMGVYKAIRAWTE
jgi:hypothetical protein